MTTDNISVSGELHERKRKLETWKTDPLTIMVFSVLQAQVDSMQNQMVLKRLNSHDEILGQEFDKGAIEGRLSIATLVDTLIENYAYEIQQLKEEPNVDN